MNIEYRPCPKCTYPVRKMLMGIENGKEVIRTYCSNNKCSYERIAKRRGKYGSRS